MTTTLGVTFGCFDDLDASFSAAKTDYQIARDEVYHRLTTDAVLGFEDDGETLTQAAADFGDDVRKLAGKSLTDRQASALGLKYTAVLQHSDILSSASVVVTKTQIGIAEIELNFAVTVVTSTGPFTMFFLLSGTTFSQVGAPPGGS